MNGTRDMHSRALRYTAVEFTKDPEKMKLQKWRQPYDMVFQYAQAFEIELYYFFDDRFI